MEEELKNIQVFNNKLIFKNTVLNQDLIEYG